MGTNVRIERPTLNVQLRSGKARRWLGRELNPRHEDFQSSALPTELPSRARPPSAEGASATGAVTMQTSAGGASFQRAARRPHRETGARRSVVASQALTEQRAPRLPRPPSQNFRVSATARFSRCMYSAREISIPPNLFRCGVSHWVSSKTKRCARRCSTNAQSATLEASVTS